MSRFNFDFKGKRRAYGAERLRTDITYNLRLVNASDCDLQGMPTLEPVDYVPGHLMGFNYAMTSDDRDATIHFFIDDYQFERLWTRPERYVGTLSKFAAVLTPDFSLYTDMPLPMQRWNEYRRRALGHYWQQKGLNVIPSLSWSDKRSYGFCFGGLPKHSTVAVSSVGVMDDEAAMQIWHSGMKAALEMLEPKRVLLYGSDPEFDWPGYIDVKTYTPSGRFE